MERGARQSMVTFLGALSGAALASMAWAVLTIKSTPGGWAAVGAIAGAIQAVGVIGALIYAGRQLRQAGLSEQAARAAEEFDRRAARVEKLLDLLQADAAAHLASAASALEHAHGMAGLYAGAEHVIEPMRRAAAALKETREFLASRTAWLAASLGPELDATHAELLDTVTTCFKRCDWLDLWMAAGHTRPSADEIAELRNMIPAQVAAPLVAQAVALLGESRVQIVTHLAV